MELRRRCTFRLGIVLFSNGDAHWRIANTSTNRSDSLLCIYSLVLTVKRCPCAKTHFVTISILYFHNTYYRYSHTWSFLGIFNTQWLKWIALEGQKWRYRYNAAYLKHSDQITTDRYYWQIVSIEIRWFLLILNYLSSIASLVCRRLPFVTLQLMTIRWTGTVRIETWVLVFCISSRTKRQLKECPYVFLELHWRTMCFTLN